MMAAAPGRSNTTCRPGVRSKRGEDDIPASETLRVGIVGAGANTRAMHIPGLRAIDGVEVVAVCNRTAESSHRVAEQEGIERVHRNWADLVTDEGVDAVVVGTWPDTHRVITVAALEAGKHVLCEARMAATLADARAMQSAAAAVPHLVAQVVPSPLSFGVDATLRRMVASGDLGSIVAIDVEARANGFPDPSRPLHWREDADRSGRNIMSLGIWYESLMRWVGEATSVTAVGSVTVPLRTDEAGRPRGVVIPDHLDVVAEMACGAQARFQMSTVTGLGGANRATLYGTAGMVRFDGSGLVAGGPGDVSPKPVEIPSSEAGRWRVEEEFVAAIRGEGDIVLTDFDTGVKYMEFTEAVWRSMGERRTIALPLPETDGPRGAT